MAEPGQIEPGQPESSGTATGPAVRIEATPALEGEGGIKTGSLSIFTEYHVLADGTVFFGSRQEAVERNRAAMEKVPKQ